MKVLSFDKVNIVVITVSGLTIWARWVRQIHRKIWPQCSVVKMFVLIIWWKHCVNVSTYFLWLLSENNTIFMQDNPLFIRGSSKLSQGKTILWTHICVIEFSSSFGYSKKVHYIHWNFEILSFVTQRMSKYLNKNKLFI